MNIKELCVNSIRILSAEAVERANSGHPGLPMGAAPIGFSVWAEEMVHNPEHPDFVNRDRFVLSAGHGSMLEYSLLYLFGYGLTKEDLMNFRQMGSKTPGHPEYGHTVGVETTTGPLGQGIANGVGMALAEAHLAAKFNRPGFPVVDHYTYVLVGDGCMQEGIESEAASFAGTMGLGKLIVLYDDNDITIEGNTDITFRENVGKRHEAQGWHVQHVEDGNDVDAISRAIRRAKRVRNKPSLIVVKTTIGYGSPLAGKADCHGSPLGAANLEAAKAKLGWTMPPFEVPQEVLDYCQCAKVKGKRAEAKWNKMFKAYRAEYPELAAQYEAFLKNDWGDLAANEDLWKFDKPDATRGTSSTVLNKLADLIPNLIGGSADLGPSNKSVMKQRESLSPENPAGDNVHFGIREHAMSAISNGMALHGGLTCYCSTFFVFTDYMKNAIRMSALMGLPVTYILTHDSIGVGEDGPTHQPVEHLAGLRAIPNVKVFRPADGKETTAAWISALSGDRRPTLIVLSRQNLPQYENSGKAALAGGYILSDSEKKVPDVILMASGSEVELVLKAQAALKEQSVDARVVSMPCMELFLEQSAEYRESVLPNAVRARVAVEAASPMSWDRLIGLDGESVCMTTFGASAPAKELFRHFGFTVENVVEAALRTVARNRR